MKLRFLTLPSDERRLYIEQAALRRNVSPVVLEKDFWVCWLLGVLFNSEFSSSLVFKGGTSLSKVFGVIERSVKLEFGSLTDQQPSGIHPVLPWVAEVLPDTFPDWRCEVVALELERTFWEKATILHSEFHRPAGKPTPDRFSRHYADTVSHWQRLRGD